MFRLDRPSLPAIVLLGVAGVAAAAGDDGFRQVYAQADAAYRAGQFEQMAQQFSRALDLRPGHPRATYNLACAQSLAGDPGAALATLGQLAARGVYYDIGADADLAPLAALHGYAGLRSRFMRLREAVGTARPVFTVPGADMIPEGIAFDARTASWFLGGAHQRKIVRVRNGRAVDFATREAGLLAPLGMAVDPQRRLLWVAHAGLKQMADATEAQLGRSGLLAFDIDTGTLRHHAMLDDGRRHVLGDLAVGADGRIHASDALGGQVFAFDASSGRFTPLTEVGAMASPQGLALSGDGKTLFVADYHRGLFAHDFEAGKLWQLSAGEDAHLFGIDGLARHGGDLIAVQNNFRPHRVVRLRVDLPARRVESVDVLAANLPDFDEPTLGVVIGDEFAFVANSQWNRFNDRHELPPVSELRDPLVLKLSLAETR